MAKSDFKNKTDEELMETYKMGEVAAFDILFERHSGQVLGYLSRKLSSSKEAQDVLQDVFFKLHRSRHQYNSPSFRSTSLAPFPEPLDCFF